MSGRISVDDPSDEVVAAHWFSESPERALHIVGDRVEEWFSTGTE